MADARAIALQGIGFGAAVLAVQGFLALSSPPVLPPSSGGGGFTFRPSMPVWVGDPLEEEEALLIARAI